MKQCPSCQTVNHDETNFCSGCGAALSAAAPTAPAYTQQPYAQPQQPYGQQPGGQPYAQQPYGQPVQQFQLDSQGKVAIGGWLLAFLVFQIIALAFNIFALPTLFAIGASFLDIAVRILYLLLNIFTIYCVVTRNNMIFYAMYALIALNLLLAILSGDTTNYGSVVGAILWTVYFHQSARVKATFPPRA